MSGRYPKPAAQRRRRNVAPEGVKLDGVVGVPMPELPFEVLPVTSAWWTAIWASPMSRIWLDSDAHALIRLALLVDAANRGKVGGLLLGEIRQLEDRFGLSPLARRRLQWEVDQASADSGADDAPEDDGRWLRAVSD